MNETIKKVEGMKKNISFSSIKKQWWVNLMYRKMKLQQLKGGKVDEDILQKKKEEAKIEYEEEMTFSQAIKALQEARNE